MGSACGKIRTDVVVEEEEEKEDRLSMLPDDLIHKIFSFISIKHAIQTSVLSTRWRYMWTSMPCLTLSSDDFNNLQQFMKYVSHALFLHNNQIQVHSVNLSFSGDEKPMFYRSIMSYPLFQNVQQVTITFTSSPFYTCTFPLDTFNSKSLKHLTMTGSTRSCEFGLQPTWNLPSLTTLHLDNVILNKFNIDKDTGLFSKCANLTTLTIATSRMIGSDGFSICHPRLCNLTLVEVNCNRNVVDAPQLRNLTIIDCFGRHLISTPNLGFLHYRSYFPTLSFVDGFRSLEKVILRINSIYERDAAKVVRLLQQLHTVKFLTLNLRIIRLLSSSVELISNQPSPFTNLKSFHILPEHGFVRPEKVTMSTEVKKYFLLDGS